ncbi:MAG: hypothetical protein QXU93_08095 [Thermoproteus sp.]
MTITNEKHTIDVALELWSGIRFISLDGDYIEYAKKVVKINGQAMLASKALESDIPSEVKEVIKRFANAQMFGKNDFYDFVNRLVQS